jgi:hypothetical protein
MQKVFVFIFLLSSFLMSSAQIAAGSRYVNGGFGFSMQNIRDNAAQYNLTSDVTGKYAFFRKENVANYISVGYRISNYYSKITNSPANWQKYTNNSQSVSLGYGKQKWFSLKNIHQNLYVTLDGGLWANVNLGKNLNITQDSTISTAYLRGGAIGFNMSPTIALFLNKKWLLQTSLGYFSTSYNLTQSESNGNYVYTHGFNFSPSFSPSNWTVGISYFWKKKE